MAQTQKDAVRNEIIDKALSLFAKKGYDESTIADVAKAAGTSVGNVYRYFTSKEEILEVIISSPFIANIRKEIFAKIGTGKSKTIREQSLNQDYLANSERFFNSMVENRLKFIVLMSCTKNEASRLFRKDLIAYLAQTFLDQFVDKKRKEAVRPAIPLLYQGLVRLYVDVLSEDADDETYVSGLKQVTKYHIFGLAAIAENE